MSSPARRFSPFVLACAGAMYLTPVAAIDITGTEIGALDQPRVVGQFRKEPPGDPLLGDTLSSSFTAVLDTGASGIVVNNFRAFDTGIGLATYMSETVIFQDTGSTGTASFFVSEELNLDLASFEQTSAPTFSQSYGPLRTQIAEPDLFFDGFDVNVVGMPAMIGKVVVLDPKPTNALGLMSTFIYEPGTPFNPGDLTDPGIPPTTHHIDLSFASFDAFTTLTTEPSGFTPPPELGPTLAHNPFIGADPVTVLAGGTDDTPGITVSFDGEETVGSFLLDTGAASSFISTALAANINVRYVAGTEGTLNPQLELFDPLNPGNPGTPLLNTFTTSITGVGGTETVAGFYLDSLLVPTLEALDPFDAADPNNLNFLGAPVVVADISVSDGTDTITLDGIFGMNFLSASVDPANLFTGPYIPTPFDWVVFDEAAGTLGVSLVPIPASLPLLGAALAVLSLRRRRFFS